MIKDIMMQYFIWQTFETEEVAKQAEVAYSSTHTQVEETKKVHYF